MAVPTHSDVQFKIRIRADLKARIDHAARQNSRSTTAEIVALLEEKYPAPNDESIPPAAWKLLSEMFDITEKLRAGASTEERRALKDRHHLLNESLAAFFDVPPDLIAD